MGLSVLLPTPPPHPAYGGVNSELRPRGFPCQCTCGPQSLGSPVSFMESASWWQSLLRPWAFWTGGSHTAGPVVQRNTADSRPADCCDHSVVTTVTTVLLLQCCYSNDHSEKDHSEEIWVCGPVCGVFKALINEDCCC